MNLLIECSADSQCGGERSNPQAEARNGEPMSRNASELDSASLHYVRVTKLPEMLKSVIGGEEIFTGNRRTLRGDWRWRMEKDNSRNLRGSPTAKALWRESDDLIVAKKRLIRVERRGSTVCVSKWKDCIRLTRRSITGKEMPSRTLRRNQMRSIQESRMRENCTSGSMRGSDGKGVACNSRPSLSTLPPQQECLLLR